MTAMTAAQRAPAAPRLRLGDSEMAQRVAGFDWSATSLGPIAGWTPSLRAAVAMCLHSRHQMAIYWGADLNCLYNDAEREILGRLHPGALGLPARELLRDSWSLVGPQLQSVIDSANATWCEDQALNFDRHGRIEVGYFTYGYSPIFDDDGTVGGVLLVTEETTSRVLAERRLDALGQVAVRSLDAHDRQAACAGAVRALEGRPDIPFGLIYLVGDNGRRAALAAAGGLPAGLAAHAQVADLADSQAPIAAALREAATAHAGGQLVDARLFIDGSAQPPVQGAGQAYLAALRRGSSESVAGFLVVGISDDFPFDEPYRRFLDVLAMGVGRSVAAARSREAERDRARSIAALDHAKTALLTNASHELRTPLTLITGPLEQALAQDGVPRGALESMSLAHRSATRMLKLVDDLLDFSRVQAGERPGNFHPTDLSQMTAEVAAMFRSTAQRAGIELTVDCAPLAEPVWVDAEAWEKIVGNLLSNALKFTPEGAIEVTLHQRDREAVLKVTDTGIGIPVSERQRVFSRLYRVRDPRVSSREGSGIGLALTRQLVRLHDGTIEAQQPDGPGTRMVVTLPFGVDHLPPAMVSQEPVPTTPGSSAASLAADTGDWLRGHASACDHPDPSERAGDRAGPEAGGARDVPRVLIAEDNADMRDYLARLLAARYSVHSVGDGEQALALAVADPPSIVITDIMMPRTDGLALLRALRADSRTHDVPIMLVSARADFESRRVGLELGADDYVSKPFAARELVARVQRVIDRSQARSAIAEARGAAQERSRREGEMHALLDDLKAAQRRVAAASDAERRRIERNLHDGAQQRLMAIRLELALISDTLADDEGTLQRALARLHSELDEALAELRELAHGLYPPLLASDGLAAALAAAARRATMPVMIEADGIGRLPPAIEGAAYFCCLEALQNAAKHAGAGAQATVALAVADGVLQFGVRDDGVGFDVGSAVRGHGLINLSDRVSALGGRVEVTSRPGDGTEVIGLIPLP